MYYVIKRSGVTSAPTLQALNKKLSSAFVDEEFTVMGPDMVVNCTDQDIDFVQDKQRMENLMFAGFFRKDNSGKMMIMITMIMVFINLILTGRIGG